MMYDTDYNAMLEDDEREYIDVDATVEALREAWKCAPGCSLSELLDSATSMPFCELSNSELIHDLNDFILQNSQKS